MKLSRIVALFFVIVGTLLAADKKPEGQQVRLVVTVERVRPDSLVVRIGSYAVVKDGGRLASNSEREGKRAVLTPGGKCAVGDSFEVFAREDGIQPEPGYGKDPLRRYAVVKAKRL